jgi:hypothetical protein
VLGCSHHPDDQEPTCEDQEPTFVMTVTVADGPLPSDTHLTVRYGGSQTEEYAVGGDAGTTRERVFCSDTPAGDAAVASVTCELYTGQAAEVTIEASGYAPLVQVLSLERTDERCIVTQTVPIQLLPPDAGA